MEETDKEFSLDSPKQKGLSRRPLAERMRSRSIDEVLGQEPVSYTHLTLPTTGSV